MNMLNSLIIEGDVTKVTKIEDSRLDLVIASKRLTKDCEGNPKEEVSNFEVKVFGQMASICERQATIGRGLRVVGRIKQETWFDGDELERSKVVIIAEHIEFKPKRPAKELIEEEVKF